jgi:ferricrocin synthase
MQAQTVSKIASLLSHPSVSVVVVENGTFDFSAFAAKYRQSICKKFGIDNEIVDSIRPCTPVQSGMLASFLNTKGDCYFNRIVLKSSTPLDKVRLKQAWSQIVARNEILRTGFVPLDDQQYPFAMVTYCQGQIALPWHDFLNPGRDFRSTDAIIKNLHQPPWYLVVKGSELITYVEFSALHALYDAHSLESIFSEVSAAYNGQTLSNIVSNKLILDCILSASSSEDPEAERFWTDLFQEAPLVKFPDLSPVHVDNPGLLVSTKISSELQRSIEDRCRNMGITLQAAGQAAWARLLSAYLGETNVAFGLVLSGRNMFHNMQDAIFPCLVTIPFPCRIQGSNRDLIMSIMKANTLLFKAQFAPLQKIQRWLKADHGLFDTLLVYQKHGSKREGLKLWEIVEDDTKVDVR